MQTIINEIAEKLSAYESKAVDEYNEVIDALEDRNTKLQEQSDVLEKQHQALKVIDRDTKKLAEVNEQLKKQIVNEKLANSSLKHMLDVAKKELKSLKSQVKRNKAAMKAKDAKLAKLEKFKGKTEDEITPLQTIYSTENDILQIYPQQLELGIEGKKRKQVALLYTDRKGCFITCCLDNDNEVAFSSFINHGADIAERTRALINKNTMQVPNCVAEFAQQWLYRVNVIQKMKIERIDLTCFYGDK
jgi:hypothetical protein